MRRTALKNERKRLERVAKSFSTREGFNQRLNAYVYQRVAPWFRGMTVLEMGCADGGMSVHLPKHFERITIVDAVQTYIDAVKKLLGRKAEYYTGLFEDVEIAGCFDTILATNVLEHVADPAKVLRRVDEWLSTNGVVIVSVPNARSIHRQVGTKMGILKDVQDLSDADVRLGHRRVYTADHLVSDIENAGFKVIKIGGVFLKPLSNGQIKDYWTVELMDAFFALAEEYPDVATPLFVIAERA